MAAWEDTVVMELVAACKTDTAYQEILNQCRAEGKNYLRIMKGLSGEDREQLDRYISLCEDLQFQLARIAYYYGRQNPRK